MEFLDLFLALCSTCSTGTRVRARQLLGAILTIVSKISAARKIKLGNEQQQRVPGTIIASIASLARESERSVLIRAASIYKKKSQESQTLKV
uniref:Uncharacterized protein n=1 Tax=Trichogramma kaykai TaxID=54128 RepID=A0ABD2WIX9_9HYME